MIRFLSIIFFLSGFASLVYQIVWQRLLTVYYGLGAYSIALIVSVFMAGLGLGALLGGKVIDRVKNRLFLYFVIELGIGIFGLISLRFLNYLGKITAGSDYSITFWCTFVFLCIPTMMMGSTLPIILKIFNSYQKDFNRSISFLYFMNTLGAAFGAVVTSYVFISFFGLDTSLYIAVALNLILACLIFCLREKGGEEESLINQIVPGSLGRKSYPLVFLTGFLAIGYEIVWFRLIGVLVKSSTYAFSTMLSIYLLGIALGSYFLGTYLKKTEQVHHRNLFFQLQFYLAVVVGIIILAYYYLSLHTPFSVFNRVSFDITLHPFPLHVEGGWGPFKTLLINFYSKIDIMFWSLIFIFLPTIIMGASFPLITALALKKDKCEGSTVGSVYFYNILGNVFGGLVTGFVLLEHLGSELTLLCFVLTGLMFGLFVTGQKNRKIRCFVPFIVVFICIFFPKKHDMYKLIHATAIGRGFTSYYDEGRDGLVATFQKDKTLFNYINGMTHGSRPGFKYYRQVSEIISFASNAENVLVIGLGAGSTVEAILKVPIVKKLTLVEINESLIDNLVKIEETAAILNDQRVEIIIDDGRRYLHRNEEAFDLIIIDPLKTTTAYSNNLYSREFFTLAKSKLTPKGIFFAWSDEFSIMPKTIAHVFEYAHFYRETGGGFFIASNSPLKRSMDRMKAYLSLYDPETRKVIVDNYPYFVASREIMQKRTEDLPLNTDLKPNCEYYIGLLIKKHFLYKLGQL